MRELSIPGVEHLMEQRIMALFAWDFEEVAKIDRELEERGIEVEEKGYRTTWRRRNLDLK